MGVFYQNMTACGTLRVLVTQTQIIANEGPRRAQPIERSYWPENAIN